MVKRRAAPVGRYLVSWSRGGVGGRAVCVRWAEACSIMRDYMMCGYECSVRLLNEGGAGMSCDALMLLKWAEIANLADAIGAPLEAILANAMAARWAECIIAAGLE